MTPLRVLIACEFSGTVRDAFTALGHDATSCDLLPSEAPGQHHQGDVLDILDDGWDLMVAHPDCTYLCRAGQRWLHAPTDTRPGKLKGLPRWAATWDAVQFFLKLREAPIARIAVENPRPGSHVRGDIGVPDQVIQPWQFGHPEAKATALWLSGLPPLIGTEDARAAMERLPRAQSQRLANLSPSADRARLRSITFPGIAAAMALQWGGDVREDAA